ncbi:MAG: hypothetical protein ACOYK8_00575 [Alphaproteobacteria bacterium]
MNDVMNWLSSDNNWLNSITTAIAVASVICAGTPTPPTDSVLGKAYKIIELLAFNFGKAKQ